MIRNRQYALDGFELVDLEAEAIQFIKEHEPPEGYFVGFSGGKDSIVALELVRMAGVKHTAYFNNTLIEHKEVYAFIKQYYPDVIWLRPKMTIYEGIRKKTPPTRVSRWCCDVLKKDPSKKIPLKQRIMGIRAEESRNRASRPRINTFNGQTHYKPIFYWKEWAVWEFIDTYKLPYPSLYDQGHARIGCEVCCMNRKSLQGDSPKLRAYKNACRDWYENKRTEKSRAKFEEKTFEAWWQWYTTF